MGRSVFRSLLLGSWVAFAAASCAVSPQPEPPSIAAETISILLDSDTLVRVVGEAGTISPAGATVTIRNLDSTMAPTLPVEVASDAEGGFVAVVPGMPAEVFRLQALSGDVRSRPLDLMGGAPGPARPFRRPLDDCFLIGGEAVVDLGAVAVGDVQSARVEMENRCPVEVVVEGVFARMGSPGVFAMAGAPPVRIASGTTRFFIVTFAPLEPGPVDAIVDVMVGPPMPHPRPITVVGLGITE